MEWKVNPTKLQFDIIIVALVSNGLRLRLEKKHVGMVHEKELQLLYIQWQQKRKIYCLNERSS